MLHQGLMVLMWSVTCFTWPFFISSKTSSTKLWGLRSTGAVAITCFSNHSMNKLARSSKQSTRRDQDVRRTSKRSRQVCHNQSCLVRIYYILNCTNWMKLYDTIIQNDCEFIPTHLSYYFWVSQTEKRQKEIKIIDEQYYILYLLLICA